MKYTVFFFGLGQVESKYNWSLQGWSAKNLAPQVLSTHKKYHEHDLQEHSKKEGEDYPSQLVKIGLKFRKVFFYT